MKKLEMCVYTTSERMTAGQILRAVVEKTPDVRAAGFIAYGQNSYDYATALRLLALMVERRQLVLDVNTMIRIEGTETA